MSSRTKALEFLTDVITNITFVEKIEENYELLSDAEMDSLDVMDMAIEIENQLDINVDDSTVDNWETVSDVIDTIEHCFIE